MGNAVVHMWYCYLLDFLRRRSFWFVFYSPIGIHFLESMPEIDDETVNSVIPTSVSKDARVDSSSLVMILLSN
jgi:hypothetical protein